ncbi:MAG: CaiB/BaiF CoA transferase family protein [Burkholderiaceae bacterium]
MSTRPLNGIKVLDFSKVLAGPICTQYLGDLGADVIKIESPGQGDDSRGWPPFREPIDGSANSFSAPYLAANRNKRSITIDLSRPEGRDIAHQLAAEADIAIESFGPGASRRLGIDAASLRAINPRLICCSISGYGSVGPLSGRKGFDLMVQALTGVLSMTGAPGGPPSRVPFSPIDQATGLHSLIGILAALNERHATGQGQAIEASLFDTSTAFLGYQLQTYWERGIEPKRVGLGHESLCPYDMFETSDRPLLLGIANDALWNAFCRLAGRDDLARDERFKTNAGRVKHRAEVVGAVQEVLRTRSHADWGAALDKANIPWAPVNELGDLSAHPHTRESGMVFEYEHPALGSVKAVSAPLRFDGQRPALQRPPPAHGEHTDQVLAELGLSAQRIAALRQAGTVG